MFARMKKELYNRVFQAVDIPSDISELTSIDGENEQDPDQLGLSSEAVEQIWEMVEKVFRSGVHPGVGFCMRKNGGILLNRTLGWSRVAELEGREGDDDEVASSQRMTLDTPICLYSASKAISAMLIHLLAEQGHINLLDPVCHYIPEFAAKGKDKISIYQLLSHRGGVPQVEEEVPVATLYDVDEAVRLICESEPICEKGRITAYHAVTSGFIFAKIIENTTGLSISQYLEKYIAKPLGFTHFGYGVKAKDRKIVAHNYVTGIDNGKLIGGALEKMFRTSVAEAVVLSNGENFYESIVPSANLFATAEEVSRFYQMMLDQGSWQGKKIFDPLTIFRATQETSKAILDKQLFLPMRYSPAMMLGGNPAGIWGVHSEQSYGHLGFSNILTWADPARDISVALLTTGKPILGPQLPALLGLVWKISDVCEPVCKGNLDLQSADEKLVH